MGCSKCGRCCRVIEFRFLNVDSDPSQVELQREFYETRGCYFETTEKETIVRIDSICPWLNLHSNLCTIHETKPEFCKMWGKIIKPTMKGCEYLD
jgi:Fe-S-cluster containining protein